MPLSPGSTVGPYQVLGPLGAGGMGEVYRARDPRLGREVAIKVLPAGVGQDPERLARFKREAQVLAALNHPNIAAIYGLEEASPSPFLVLELVDGEGVAEVLGRGPLALDRVLDIAEQVAGALEEAHARGIVHRDLKPDNIRLTKSGRVKVLDFGLAKADPASSQNDSAESATRTHAATTAGTILGTAAYMSPEQARGRPVDPRSDLWSFGILLYEMLAGRPPFAGESLPDVLAAVLRDAIDWSALPSTTPEPLRRLLARCLERDLARRIQSMAEARLLLREAAGAATPDSSFPSRADRPSIVVLPFGNLSPDPDNAYFSDGLTEEIIADLSKVKGLRVISRTSSMQLKGTGKDVQTIGRELQVRYVLEGGVRKAGTSLRITAQLVDAQSDAPLWAEKFGGTVDDVFEVQERVSREIVRALDVTLSADESRRLASRPMGSARAFELFLRARQEMRRMGGDALERASALLQQAVEIEGETPPLLAFRAWAKVAEVRAGLNRDGRPLDEAEAHARAVLAGDAEAADAYALLGYIGYERGRLAEAVRHFQQALAREPGDADSLFFLGVSYVAAGDTEGATETGRRLVASDPLSPLAWTLSGVARWFVGRLEEALPDLRRALDLDPQSFIGHWTLGYGAAAAGRLDEAEEHADFLVRVGPEGSYTRQLRALVAGLRGRKEEALQTLEGVDTRPLDGHHTFHLAEAFAVAGAEDRALDLLDAAVTRGFYPTPFLTEHCPFLGALRPLPRFAEVLSRAQERSEAFRREAGAMRPASFNSRRAPSP